MEADIAAGLTWSVPASIAAQAKLDNVMWVNQSNAHMQHWSDTGVYYTLKDIGGKLDLRMLPCPFCHPDIVVFEGFYSLKEVFFSWKLNRKKVPYIIIPRGSLAKQAFHNHGLFNYLKKRLACLLLFMPYTKKAIAIQYLTKQELIDSGSKWTDNPIIIPNGFDTPVVKKTLFSKKGLKVVFIGRPTIFQKGIDIIIETCVRMKKIFFDNDVFITMHVPYKNDYNRLASIVESADINDVFELKDAVRGKEKEEALLKSDIFIMTSRFEGHPMGLVEALAYGIPVIVTPGCNMADEIKEENAGWVCETDVASLCNLFNKVIVEKSELPVKGQNARRLSEKYQWNRIADTFHTILNESINSV